MTHTPWLWGDGREQPGELGQLRNSSQNLEHSRRVLKSSETVLNLGINLREGECGIC